jgi:hypothetical protein
LEISARAFITATHGLLFGGFFLLAIFGLVVELVRANFEIKPAELCSRGRLLASFYLWASAAMGWIAVFLGAYIVYPWYRAVPPAGTANLTAFPQRLLLASSTTSGWHSPGMEWKEHVAWLAPMAVTMVAYILSRQRAPLKKYPQVRNAVLVFAVTALTCAGIAALFGAMINKHAPVEGGSNIHIVSGR